ncbi:MAG: thiamine biosynthesis protein ThiC [Cellvibrionaceae bacterium]|nr:thiamine biosynthesis protein ThiC [Cellvibrionaceae bacterium]
MKFTNQQTVQTTSYLLLALVATQALYTVLYIAEMSVPRQLLWGLEGLLFTVLVVFAGAALVQSKYYQVGWSAIAFSAVLNVVQVSIGLTLFGPFREAAGQLEALEPAAGAVVALSFMIYYAAKLLLGFAALIFGIAKMKGGSKALGGLTALVGIVAVLANAVLIMFGRDAFLPSPVAGGSGVLATLLLALCLTSVDQED